MLLQVQIQNFILDRRLHYEDHDDSNSLKANYL